MVRSGSGVGNTLLKNVMPKVINNLIRIIKKGPQALGSVKEPPINLQKSLVLLDL